MGVKFVIGLTDLESEDFIYSPLSASDYYTSEAQIDGSVYVLQTPTNAYEKASIEWDLDTTLPAVSNLLIVLETIKSKMHIIQIHWNKYVMPDSVLYATNFLIELKNLIPDTNLILPEYDSTDYDNISFDECSLELDASLSEWCMFNNTESLHYAMSTGDYNFLRNGPTTRFVYPAFRINFHHSTDSGVPDNTMSDTQREWMLHNKDLLESKGYYMSDSRNKIGAIGIGKLIGTYEDAFLKVQQYNRICRVEIVKE